MNPSGRQTLVAAALRMRPLLPGALVWVCRPGQGGPAGEENISLWRLLLHFTFCDLHSHSAKYFTLFSILLSSEFL